VGWWKIRWDRNQARTVQLLCNCHSCHSHSMRKVKAAGAVMAVSWVSEPRYLAKICIFLSCF
jgi:hypothetical protein